LNEVADTHNTLFLPWCQVVKQSGENNFSLKKKSEKKFTCLVTVSAWQKKNQSCYIPGVQGDSKEIHLPVNVLKIGIKNERTPCRYAKQTKQWREHEHQCKGTVCDRLKI